MQIPNYGWVVILLVVAGVAFAAGGYSTQALVKPAPVEVKTVPVYVTVYPTAPPVQYSAPVATQAQKTTQTLSGSGSQVKHINLKKGPTEFFETISNTRYISAWVYDLDGKSHGLAVSAYKTDETKLVVIPRDGEYIITVEHEGPWTIDIKN